MAVNVGSAVGYLDLDIGGFVKGLDEAQRAANETVNDMQKSFATQMQNIGKSMTEVGKTLTKAITVPVLGAGAVLLKMGSDVNTEFANLRAVTGMTGDEMKQFENVVKNTAYATAFSLKEVAAASKMIAESGGDMGLMQEQISMGATLARATQSDLAETMDFLASTMKAFGKTEEDTKKVADSIAYTTTVANVTLSQMAEAYKNVVAQASTAGLSIDEVNAFIKQLADNGIKGGRAGTELSGVLRNLSQPTSKAADALAALNVKLFDMRGNQRNALDVMNDLTNAFSKLTDEQRKQAESDIFDTVSLSAWNVIAKDGIAYTKELAAEMGSAEKAFGGIGQATRMAAENANTTAGSMQRLKNMLAEIGVIFDRTVSPYIAEFVKLLGTLSQWFQNLPESTQRWIFALAGIAAAIGPVIMALGWFISALGTVIGAIGPVVSAIAGFISVFNPVTVAIGVVVAAITAWGVALYELYQENEEFRKAVDATWKSLVQAFYKVVEVMGPVVDAIKDGILWVLNEVIRAYIDYSKSVFKFLFENQTLRDEIEGIWNEIVGACKQVVEVLKPLAKMVSEDLQWAFDQMKAAFQAAGSAIKDYWNNNEELRLAVTETWNAIKIAFNAARETLVGGIIILTDALKELKQWWAEVWPHLYAVLEPILNLIKNQLQITADLLIGIWRTLIALLTGEWQKAWDIIYNTFIGIGEKTMNGAKKLIADFKALFTGAAEGTTDDFYKALNSPASQTQAGLIGTALAKNTVAGYSRGMASQTNNLALSVHNTLAEANKQALLDAIANGEVVGTGMIDGTIEGVDQNAPRLYKEVNNTMHQATDAAMRALDIRSPSGVFRDEVGANMVEGMILGFKDMLPYLIQQIKLMFQSMDFEKLGSEYLNFDWMDFKDIDFTSMIMKLKDLFSGTSIKGIASIEAASKSPFFTNTQSADLYAKMIKTYIDSSGQLVRELTDYGKQLGAMNVWEILKNDALSLDNMKDTLDLDARLKVLKAFVDSASGLNVDIDQVRRDNAIFVDSQGNVHKLNTGTSTSNIVNNYNYTFNSPDPITAADAAAAFAQTQKELAYGF